MKGYVASLLMIAGLGRVARAVDLRMAYVSATTDRRIEITFDVVDPKNAGDAITLESRPVRVAIGQAAPAPLRPHEVLRVRSTAARRVLYLDLATGERLTLVLGGARGTYVRVQTPELLNLLYARMATGAQPTELWAVENRLDLWCESVGEKFNASP